MNIPACLLPLVKIAVLLLAGASPLLAAAPHAGRHVLVIHSYHAGLSWTDAVTDGIRDAFARNGDQTEISVEYLDARRYPDPEMAERIRALIVAKLEEVTPDLVLVSDNAALDFVLAQRERLFPEVPIVFCGVNSFTPAMIANHRQITGVAEDVSVVETVALALRLHPTTREIIVLGRTSVAADKANRDSFVAALPRLPAQLGVSFWDDLPLAALQARLERLGQGSVIVLNGLITDETGHQLMYAETTKWVSSHTGVPVYSLWDVYLGHGIVGGKLVSAYRQGQLAGDFARRILNGESADRLPMVNALDANRPMFDYRQLERFAVPLATLPADALVINRPDSFYERHRTIVWTTAAIVLGLSSLVLLLGINVVRRRRAEEALRQANLVVESSPVVLFRWQAAAGWPVVLVSKNVIQFGYTPEELLSGAVPFSSMVHPEDLERVAAELKEHSAAGFDQFQQQYRLVTKAGEVRWVEDHTVMERGVEGRIVCYQGTLMDITERKQAEAALQESERKFRDLVEKAIVGVYLVQDGAFKYVNARFAEMHGCSAAEMIGKMANEAILPEDWPGTAEIVRKRAKGEWPSLPAVFRIVTRNGGLRYIEDYNTGTVYQGRPARIGTAVDITERKRAEEALQNRMVALTQPLDAADSIAFEDLFDLSALQRLQDLTAKAWGVAALITRPDGSPITQPGNFTPFCSDFMRKTEKGFRKCQLSDAELGRHNPSGPVIQKCMSAGLCGAGASITVGGRHIGNWLIGQVRNEAQSEEQMAAYARELDHDETAFWKAFLEVPVMPQEKFEQIAQALFELASQLSTIAYQNIQQARFISERKRAEEEMRRLRNYLSNIINSMPSVLVGVDTDGRITHWNTAAEQATGMGAEQVQGQPLEQVLPAMGHQLEKLRQAMRARTVEAQPKVPRMVDGEVCYEDVTVYPLMSNGVEGAVIRVDDVTERVRIEEMMVQSEKMLSVGGLAAGMAHEINNPLGVVLQAAQNITRRLSPELPANSRVAEECGTSLTSVREYLARREILTFLEDVRQSGQRAAEIVANMLSFSRKAEGGGTPTDLAALLDRTVSLAATDYDLKKHYDFRQIEIVREYEAEVPQVICQAGKIQQVFLNVLRNGAEAMVTAGELMQTPRFLLRVAHAKGMVRVEIEDNGPGMDEATRKRVFEPFFTTKPPGSGTGLGLSVSYFIITEDHGGSMSVESEPGAGTRFVIQLPVAGRKP